MSLVRTESVLWNYTPAPSPRLVRDCNLRFGVAAGARQYADGIRNGTDTQGYLPAFNNWGLAGSGEAYGGDLYNRVHISTSFLDVGNLVSNQFTTLWVWNAWRRAVTLDQIQSINAEGVQLTGQSAPPLGFQPQQLRTYELGILTDGPPTIDAQLRFDMSTGESLGLSIVGSRITGFGWTADWSRSIVERLEWSTDVLTAYRGEEQRRALRLGPRKTIEFDMLLDGVDRQAWEVGLWGWGSRVWAVPLWWDGIELDSGLASGSATINLDTTTRDFKAGGLAVLIGGQALNLEVVELDQVTTTSLVLKRPTVQAWGLGTRVYPARVMRLDPRLTLARFTGEASTVRLRFQAVDADAWSENHNLPSYRGFPVLDLLPNWSGAPDLSLERELVILDSGTGVRSVADPYNAPVAKQRLRYSWDRIEADTWRRILHALRGRQGAVWVPTWTNDLDVVAQVESAEAVLNVARHGYTRFLSQATNRQDLRIELQTGQVFYRRITGSTEETATTERLVLDAPLGVTVPLGGFRSISYMMLARQDSDAAELAWWTGETVDVSTTMRSFRHNN